jgi:hypothetical protein
MNELFRFCKTLKEEHHSKKPFDREKPVSFWSEKDVLDGSVVDAFVMILRTRGCTWAFQSGCSMCGYFNDSAWSNVSSDELMKQYTAAMEKYAGQPIVKIFTSGSFFDECEIPVPVRSKILVDLGEKTQKVVVESRPEYIVKETVSDASKVIHPKTLEVGIGLETADDFIREHSINKGFTLNDYKKAAELLRKNKCSVKTYVLVKPPFLTEEESIRDSIATVKNIKSLTDTFSFNPVNVQRRTFVEYLWKRRQYRPPWLWSIVEILKNTKNLVGTKRIQCDVTGGGSIRGAHNCRTCDSSVLNAIRAFSLSQDVCVFDDLFCDCKEQWLDQRNLENLGFGSCVDFSGEPR